jgi:hypothetical protein
MNKASVVLGLVGALACWAPAPAQEPGPVTGTPCPNCAPCPTAESCGSGTGCCQWARSCFPRGGCCDDYCAHPYPRPCWPPYPPFYQCVPAGHCAHPPCVGVGNEKLTWWWVPTPRALREALWCQP